MSNLKRILALAITMLMVVGCFASFASVSAFEDVEKYEDEINALYRLGIIEGKDAEGTTFAPDENVTRWQMALLIAKMMTGKVNDAYVNWYSTENFTPFTDVNKDQFYGSMSYAHNMGVIIGTTPTTFNPNGEITYQDALTMVVRALGYGSAEMDAGYPWTFVNKAIELGIERDFEEDLNYGTALTRGQVAKLLYNTLFTQRYNDYTTFDQETDTYRYTTFAQDVFGYFDAALTAIIVAAEDFYLNPTLEANLGVALDYDNYDVIVPEKRASYVGFVLAEDLIGGGVSPVLVLPASEFGLEAPDRLQIGTTYSVAIDNQGEGIVSGFTRCNPIGEYKLAETFAFSNNPKLNADTTIATNVTIDGNNYVLTDDITATTDILTDGTPNATSDIHYIMVIRRNDNSIVYGVPAVNTVEQDLLCIDLDGDGYYDLAYQINYVFGNIYGARNEGGYYTDGGNCVTLNKPYNGDTLEPMKTVAGGYYYYEFTNTWAGGANWFDPDNGSGIFFIKKGVGIKATGVVTGVDLYNKTVTLDGVNADKPGTTYKVAGASETDTHTAGLAFDKDLMGRRVNLYANDTTGEIVLFTDAPLAGAVAQTMFAIFVQDTGRTVKVNNKDRALVAVYDVTGALTYVTATQTQAQLTALGLNMGDMLELTLKDNGLYEFAALDPAYNDGRALRQTASTLEQVVEWSNAVVDQPMTVWHYMPIIADTYYLDFQNATVLGFNGTSFKQYNGKDLGDGTTIVPDDGSAVRIYMKRDVALPNNEFDLHFMYVQGDINATAAVSYSKALSSIVYVSGDPNSHAYSNYDMIGTMPTGVGDITFYNAVDMVSGEFRAVKTSGVYGYVVPAGFYFVDKDGNLGGDASAEIEIGTQLGMNAHAGQVRDSGFIKRGATVKKVNIDGTYKVTDQTATIMTAGAGTMPLAGAFWEAAWTTNDGNVAIYKGTAYASDVVVALVIDGGVSPF